MEIIPFHIIGTRLRLYLDTRLALNSKSTVDSDSKVHHEGTRSSGIHRTSHVLWITVEESKSMNR